MPDPQSQAPPQPSAINVTIRSKDPGFTYSQPTMEDYVRDEARAAGVNPDLALAVMRAESGGNVNASAGPQGGQGAMQVLNSTAAKPGFGIAAGNAKNPSDNARLGVQYLKAMLTKYPGDEDRALAAYTRGPGATLAAGPIDQQGLDYIKRVRGFLPQAAAAPAQRPAPGAPVPVPKMGEQTPLGDPDPVKRAFDTATASEKKADAAKGPPPPNSMLSGGEYAPLGDTGFVAGMKRSALGQAAKGVGDLYTIAKGYYSGGPESGFDNPLTVLGKAALTGGKDVLKGAALGRLREAKDAYTRGNMAMEAASGSIKDAIPDAGMALIHGLSMLVPGLGDIVGPGMERWTAGDPAGAVGQAGSDLGLIYAGGKLGQFGKETGGAPYNPVLFGKPAPGSPAGTAAAHAAETAELLRKAQQAKAIETQVNPPPPPAAATAPAAAPAAPAATTAAGAGVKAPKPAQAAPTAAGGPPAPASVRVQPTVPEVAERVQAGSPQPPGIWGEPTNPEVTMGAEVSAPPGATWIRDRAAEFLKGEQGFADLGIIEPIVDFGLKAAAGFGLLKGAGMMLSAAKAARAAGNLNYATAIEAVARAMTSPGAPVVSATVAAPGPPRPQAATPRPAPSRPRPPARPQSPP